MLRNPEKTLVHHVLYPFWVVLYWVCLLAFGLLALIVNVSCVFTALLPAGDWRYGFYQAMIRRMSLTWFFVLRVLGILRVQHIGFEALATDTYSVKPILVANHPNLFDVFLFYSKLPRLTCIYKSSLQKTLIKSSMGEQIGFISNANSKKMILEGAQRIHTGEQLVIFPEGTRTVSGPLNELKSGAAGIARRADVGLQTVVIHCGSNFLSKNRSVLKPPILPILTRIEVGEVFHPRDYATSQALNQAMAAYFKAKLQEVRTFE
ncbi:lysophospholipid acyltransferase family protein [Coraliomargarita sp. W4R72]